MSLATHKQFQQAKRNIIDTTITQKNIINIPAICYEKCVIFPGLSLSAEETDCLKLCSAQWLTHQKYLAQKILVEGALDEYCD